MHEWQALASDFVETSPKFKQFLSNRSIFNFYDNHDKIKSERVCPMIDTNNVQFPKVVKEIERKTRAIGFAMASDMLTGSLLKTLATTKPNGNFLELGTGTGLSAAWILAGMDSDSTLSTVDNDEKVVSIARQCLGDDPRVTFHVADGAVFIESLAGQSFDFIFADTWPGKFHHLAETLQLLKVGGLYIIDDMLPQPSWPEDHAPKVPKLISTLEQRQDLNITKLNWSTGLVVATRKSM